MFGLFHDLLLPLGGSLNLGIFALQQKVKLPEQSYDGCTSPTYKMLLLHRLWLVLSQSTHSFSLPARVKAKKGKICCACPKAHKLRDETHRVAWRRCSYKMGPSSPQMPPCRRGSIFNSRSDFKTDFSRTMLMSGFQGA